MMSFPHRHLLGIKGLSEPDIHYLLDQADEAVKISRQREKKTSTLRGLTQINLFFESLDPHPGLVRTGGQAARRGRDEHVGRLPASRRAKR
jgi:hypothetical protein